MAKQSWDQTLLFAPWSGEAALVWTGVIMGEGVGAEVVAGARLP